VSPATSVGPWSDVKPFDGSPWPMNSTLKSTSAPNFSTTSLNAFSAWTPYGHYDMT
jgi:hypothetical protein